MSSLVSVSTPSRFAFAWAALNFTSAEFNAKALAFSPKYRTELLEHARYPIA
jgi:hypothetical protein